MSIKSEIASHNFISEWTEVITRDRNHPSIITWVPFNQPLEDALALLTGTMMRLCIDTYQQTKAIDPSRPVNGIAGDVHFMSDIWSIRNYESNATRFAQQLKPNNRMAFYNNQPFSSENSEEYFGLNPPTGIIRGDMVECLPMKKDSTNAWII